MVSLDLRRDFSKVRRLYSGRRGAVGQVTGVERPEVLKWKLQGDFGRNDEKEPPCSTACAATKASFTAAGFQGCQVGRQSEQVCLHFENLTTLLRNLAGNKGDYFGLAAKSSQKKVLKRQSGRRYHHATIQHFTVFSLDLYLYSTLTKSNIKRKYFFIKLCATQNKAKEFMRKRQNSAIFQKIALIGVQSNSTKKERPSLKCDTDNEVNLFS